MEVFPTMVLLTWWSPRLPWWLEVRAGVGGVLWVASRNAALVFHSPDIIIIDIELLLFYISKKHAFGLIQFATFILLFLSLFFFFFYPWSLQSLFIACKCCNFIDLIKKKK